MQAIARRTATTLAGSRARLATAALLILGAISLMATPASGAPAEKTVRPVFRVADLLTGGPLTPVGSSRLIRTDRGVSATLETRALTAGDVVTLWWVVFNDPGGCEAGFPGVSSCGPGDAHAGRGGVSLVRATGRIVGEDGTASYGARARVGDTSGALAGPGLVDPRRAEVILVLKTHGPKIPRLAIEQLHTFAGGCADQSDAPPGAPPELVGAPGPNDCAEIQVSVHSPVP